MEDKRVPFHPEVGVVVLAAGLSSRMKEMKQLLPLGNGSLIEQVLSVVVSSEFRPIILVLGHQANRIWASLPASIQNAIIRVDNEDYQTGLAGSVRVGVAALPAHHACFVVLGDQPFLCKSVMEELVNVKRANGGRTVRPTVDGQPTHPVLLSPRMIERASELQGDQGFRTLLQGALTWELSEEHRSVAFDVDTPEQYRQLLDLYQRRQHGHETTDSVDHQ